MRRAVSVPNAGDPGALVDFAVELEEAGWDGFFLWDHLQLFAALQLDLHDPWLILAAAARATRRIRLGTAVTPISRRTPWKLAKEVVTLDHLSGGRAVIGVGLGGPDADDFAAFGDSSSFRQRAGRTDEALELLDQVLRGRAVDHAGHHFSVHAHLHPAAVQHPRPPVWTAATPPHVKPLERARRWDGVFCNVKIESDSMPLTPGELRDYLGELLNRPGFDVVTTRHPAHGAAEYEDVGVAWLVEGSWPEPDWLNKLRARLLKTAP